MSNKRQGIIIKIDSNKSWIFTNGEIYQVDIKKTLLQHHQPVVGDKVWFEITNFNEKTGLILSFLERENFLSKPKLANIDQILIVTALREPEFNSYLLNKYLIFLNTTAIKPVLIFTKSDLINSERDTKILEKVNIYNHLGYKTLIISNKNVHQDDFEKLKKLLDNKVSVLVGQTGAGKSTTLNHFLPKSHQIKTQIISKALNRGKHTTTTIQFHPVGKSILVADTPGFGNFDLKSLEVEKLIDNLPLLKPYLSDCKYPNCTHSSEKYCSLKNHNQIPKEAQFIYDDYCQLINEIKTKRGKVTWKKRK